MKPGNETKRLLKKNQRFAFLGGVFLFILILAFAWSGNGGNNPRPEPVIMVSEGDLFPGKTVATRPEERSVPINDWVFYE